MKWIKKKQNIQINEKNKMCQQNMLKLIKKQQT